MRADQRFTLSRRRINAALRIALPALLAMVLALVWTADVARKHALSTWETRLSTQARHRKDALAEHIEGLRREMLFLSALPPVQGIVRASLNGGFDAQEQTSIETWKRRLRQIFAGYAAIAPDAIQLRYIGVANNGLELVRVDRGPRGVLVIPPDQLQAKGDRDYFKATLSLKSGETYISDLNLNQEHGRIQEPHLPTLRVTTPVFGPDGKLFGMVVINIDARTILSDLRADMSPEIQAYLTNGDGDYLLNPDAAVTFGFDLGQRHRWQDDFTGMPSSRGRTSGLLDYAEHGAVMHLVTEAIPYDARVPTRRLTFTLGISDAVIASEVAEVRNLMLGALVLGALLIGGFTFLYWRQRERATIEQARLAAIVTSSADAIIGKTLEGVVTDWNQGAETMFGYPAQDAIGHTILSLIVPPEHAREETEILTRIMRGEAVPQFETVRHRRDGSRLNVSITVSPIRASQGVIVGASKTVRDVTRQKEAEEALKKAKAQLKAFIQQAPVSIAMFDRDMKYLAFSGLWLAHYGRGYTDLTGHSHYEVHPDLPDEWKRVHQQGLAGATLNNDEDLWIQADGSKHWLRWAVLPWLDENGQIGGIIMSSEDITRRKRSEEDLRIAAVAFQSRDGMIVTDAEGVILRVNRAFTEAKGYRDDEVVGNTPALWSSGRQDPAFYRNMWEAIAREGRWEGQIWNRRKDGGIYPEWLAISSVCDETGVITHYIGTFSDIRDPKEAERKIIDLAFYDSLTDLPNRRLMLDRLQQALASSARSHQFGAVLLLDLDHFKTINDTRGHDVGDELLIEVARRLRGSLRQMDTAARLGGDEFVVLLEELHLEQIAAATIAEAIAEKLCTAIGEPFLLKGETHHVTCSMGVTLFRSQNEDAEALFKQADLALYQAKDAGRNAVRFYNASMQAAVDARTKLETGLRRAVAKNEFLLHYQPQADAHGVVVGAEALLRWQPPGRALTAAGSFIQAAEESGLIVPIGYWVLESACRQLRAWAENPTTRDLIVSINVSARQFRQAGLIDQVTTALEQSGASPNRLRFELTESLLLQEVDTVIQTMQQIKKLGVRFSIDDFGTGYSSLTYLKRLPLDELKIDRSFVRHIEDDADDRAIVQAIISLGNSLALRVIAEGVETEAQRNILAAQGCKFYQGYLFGRPSPARDIEAMV